MIRQKELQEGINVFDEKGETTLGKSKTAAKRAIMETATTRFLLPLPVLFIPALANFALLKMRLWPKNIVAGKLIETALCCGSLAVALPMSIALF